MKVELIVVGKTSFDHVKEGIEMYLKRLKHLADFEYKEIALKPKKMKDGEGLKREEGQEILKAVGNSKLILLDERGKAFDSVQFASYIDQFGISGTRSLSFVIGGAYGFSEEVYQKAAAKVSLSKMTFSHQIVRLIALEQIYRAHTIIKGMPYHHA